MFSVKKLGMVIICTLLFSSLLAACSNSNKNENASNSVSSPSTEASASDSASDSAEPSEPAKEPITIKFFDKNKGDAFDDPIAQEIMKRTGVKVETQQPTGNPTEKLNLMLVSGDFPDVIMFDRGSDILNKYIAAGAIIPLDDLIKQLGPDVSQMYGEILKKTRYTDGKNYYLSNWYGEAKNEAVFGFNMKMDIVKELAPDKANGDVPFTMDEFEKLLLDFKAKYPKLGGQTAYALTMDGSNMNANIGTFKGMFGLKNYYEVDGKLQYDVQDPKYREMIMFMNKLSREGLVDPEWALSKREKWLQNIGNANFLGTPGAYWDLGTPNTNLKKAGGEDKQYFQYKVVAPGVDPAKTTYGPTSTLGWDAIGISKSNKHPEETMKFINYLASEEGQTLLMWGMEGVQYDVKDGKKVPRDGVLQAFKDNWDKTIKETGVRKWTWFVKGGTGSDGTTTDMAARYERGEVDRFAIKTLGDSGWVTDAYDNLGPLGGTPDTLIAQKVKDIMDQTLTMVINAKTEEEATKTFDKMLADMKAAGSEKVEKIINDHYQEKLALWK